MAEIEGHTPEQLALSLPQLRPDKNTMNSCSPLCEQCVSSFTNIQQSYSTNCCDTGPTGYHLFHPRRVESLMFADVGYRCAALSPQ